MSNTKNCFQVDLPDNDPDMEDLRALKKVKDAISKKKKEIKEKDWNNKHPKLTELVDYYRRRTLHVGEERPDGKIPITLQKNEVKEDVKESLDEKPTTRKIEVEIKTKDVDPKTSDSITSEVANAIKKAAMKPKTDNKSLEKAFNQAINKSLPEPPKVSPFNPQTGKFF